MTKLSDLEAYLAAADKAREAMLANPTQANIKAYHAASAAVEEARALASESSASAQALTFKTIKDALEYIHGQGYKCGRSKLSADVRSLENPVRRNEDGHFTQAVLDAYCKTLTPLAGVESDSNVDQLVLRKMKADTERAEVKARLEVMEEKIKNKELIPPSEAFLVFAGLFAQFRADVDSFIYGKGPELVQVCDGDEGKTADVLQFLLDAKAEWMNRFFRAWKNNQPLAVPAKAVREAARDLAGAI